MHNFPTVKEIIEQLQQFPQDAEVHIGAFSAFLEEKDGKLESTIGRITEKVAYEMFPAYSVEYGEFYEDAWNTRCKGWIKRKCVVISTG